MSAELPATMYFGREIDYLEDLGAKLRNLQGFTTLAHELLQNADDVPGATIFTFNVCDDALIVENDGKFSDCSRPELRVCPWKEAPNNGSHLCDFHRFQLVASADKRNEADTTGAFGIGFISVYQITDHPELISGRHWILDESQPANRRITQCPGCTACHVQNPGTRFRFPWASNPNSVLRQKLRVEPTANDTPEKLLAELERSLPTAMLFLKKLSTVEIMQDGRLLRRLQRKENDNRLLVTDGHRDNDSIWHLIRGDFSTLAEELRALNANRIERKRSAEVVIAIPVSPLDSGLLFATLPTQQRTGLPFHLNADFYPSEDRKRIILEQDFQSQWNRAAIAAGARALAASLDKLPTLLGHQRLWELLDRVEKVPGDEGIFASFWTDLSPSLASAAIIYTNQKKWRKPGEVFYFQQPSEKTALPVLEDIGFSFVHEDLRSYKNLFTSPPISVRGLTIQYVADALKHLGLTTHFQKHNWPPFLNQPAALRSLWEEINLLLNRRLPSHLLHHPLHSQAIRSLSPLALAVSRDGALRPCTTVYRVGRPDIERIFSCLDPTIRFAAPETNSFVLFSSLCPEFGPAQAIQVLQKTDVAAFAAAVSSGVVSLTGLFGWLAEHRTTIIGKPPLKISLATLSIYPSGGSYCPLTSLSLPGNFTDPLQLAALLDVNALPKHHDLLRELGIQELSFPVYVSQHLIPALRRTDLLADKRRAAALLVASRRSEISEDQAARAALASVPLVECGDGKFHAAFEVYFPSQIVSEVLGNSGLQATLPVLHETTFTEMFKWLGVADDPRFEDIVARIKILVATPPTTGSLASIRAIFGHLASRYQNESPSSALNELRTFAWLPARKLPARWFMPAELCAAFQDYLFESQALFLDIDRSSQTGGTAFLEFLAVKTSPSVGQVVAHLLHCAQTGTPVNQEVYGFLNRKADNPAIFQLRSKPCLLMPDGHYIQPGVVFWSEHPFGRFRKQLGQELRKYNDLFKSLGIREGPNEQDALKVLSELSEEFGSRNRSLDVAAHAVILACWRMLESALENETVSQSNLADLKAVKCIPNADLLLSPPSWIFFEDRAGLAAKFAGFLKTNAIARPMGSSKAMAASGVRTLVTAVEAKLLECRNASEYPALAQRIQERRLQLARVLDAQADHTDPSTKLAELDLIRFETAELLRISYHLEAFGQSLSSAPEDCPALYRSSANLLLFVLTEGRVPWTSISRELALALYPDDEPGRIASALKDVLSAETLADATAVLDELGFSTLESTPTSPVAGTETIGSLGGTSTPPETVAVQPSSPAPTQAAEAVLEGPATPPTQPAADFIKPQAPLIPPAGGTGTNTGCDTSRDTTGGAGAQNAPRPRAPRRGKLRSYVVRDTTPPDGESDSGKVADRAAIDEAGIAKVVAFEQAEPHKRQPKVMPKNHPGYDIESRDTSGEIERYIEVKSRSGLWGDDGVGLTSTQFSKARELGEQYWLYVVENAAQPDAQIYRIQNPAGKVEQFLYDAGWQDTAEPKVGT